MSLILEALKKSEAERRLGRAPDLLTPASMPSPERRPWLWLWGAVFGLAAALLLVLGWWARSALEAPSATTTSPAMPAAAPTAAASVTPALPSAPAPAPTSASTPVQRTPADVIANAPLPQDQAFASTERESIPVPAHAIPLPPPEAPPSQPANVQPIAPVLPTPPSPVVPVPAPSPVPTSSLEPLQHLATLPASLREGLPPLRLSMHVYDPDPVARFVLIDGKRYRQGDAIAPGIIVDDIRPDGVAIMRGQQRFLISRP